MAIVNGHTKTLGLIGNPVAHTLSPVIHNELAEIYNHNLVYLPFQVDTSLEDAIKGAGAMHFGGLNITVPYKTDVISHLVEIDDFAKRIGAVNTLVPVQGGFKGYNTDIPGLYRSMQSDGVSLENEKVIILGAGGAGRSIAMLALDKGAECVYLLNRTLSKAQAVAEEVNRYAGASFVTPMALSEYEKLSGCRYLCIQATSVGLFPNVEKLPIEEDGFYDLIHTGYDIIYNPYETAFMSKVKAHGGQAYNGLKMLLYQGIIAYELWNNISVSQEAAEQVLQKLKEALGLS